MPRLGYRHARTIASGFRGSLRGITVDSRDRVYAAGDAEIRVFEGDALARRWATAGPVHTVAIANDGRVFAGESRQIEIFNPSGRLLDTWRDADRLGRVSAIGFSNGDVLAGDSHGRAIRRFDAAGRFLNDIGVNNRTRGFVVPNGVVDFGVDRRGIVHAANPGKHRVERYTLDGELLGHIGCFGGLDPAGFSGCCNPTNVCVAELPAVASRAPTLRIFTTEKAGPRVKVHDEAGALVAIVADAGFDPNCKNMDVAVDSRGRVHVVDTVRLEIRTFEPEAE
jgi:sugar lactone lactonase YvrE